MKTKQYQTIKNDDGTFGAIVTEVELVEAELRISPIEEMEDCKAKLAESDYKAIKYAEGLLTAEEYAPIKAERQALRDRINELEKEL